MINVTHNSKANTGSNATPRVVPVLSVERISHATQDPSKNKQFVMGQVYQAKVLEKISDKVQLVSVNKTMLKMDLGANVKAGQTLPLRFLQLQPVPTFLLESKSTQGDPKLQLSSFGKLIGSILHEAKAAGASARYQAQGVVSQQPANAMTLASDLKRAITRTGLFYESHLSDFARGARNLEGIRQEPQNLNQTQLSTLVSQQLSVLETNKLSWNGQIWPGQQMALDVFEVPSDYVQAREDEQNQASHDEQTPMQTDLSLDLPALGKVKAQLKLVNGKVSIQLSAQNEQTRTLLASEQSGLVNALEARGSVLEGLSVTSIQDKHAEKPIFRSVKLAE